MISIVQVTLEYFAEYLWNAAKSLIIKVKSMISLINRTLGRRRFLSTAVMTLAATQLSMTACEEVNSSVPKPAGVPTMKPGTNTSLSTPLPAQLGPPFTHQIAQVNGIRVHYVIGGQGFPVVLLHGWPETWYEWRKIMPALAKKYTVIAPDSRGLGDSERTESGYDAATLAEDLFSLVHSLGFQQIFLVGHDVGASTAYAYAARYREAVQRLVILDVPLEGFGREDFAAKRNIWWYGFFQAPGSLAESLAVERERILLGWFFSRAGAAITQEDVDEYVRWYTGRDALRAGFAYYQAFSTNAQLFQGYNKEKLSIPVLALGGENGGAGWPFYSLSQVAEHVSGGIIPQCGHYIAEEQPEELLRQLNAFFSGQEE